MSGSADDFETGDDLYDAIGDLLHEIAVEKDEDDVRYVVDVTNVPKLVVNIF